MNPQDKKSPKKLIIFFSGLMIFSLIIVSLIIFKDKQMAPGNNENHEPIVAIENQAIEMEEPVVPDFNTTSEGTIKTENGDYKINGL